MFTEDQDPESMEAAVEAGVSAYIVAGLQGERIKPVLQVALAQFKREQKLLEELSDTKSKLAERKVIERAKGILMKQRHCSEEEAFVALRSLAMQRGIRLGEAAQQVIDVTSLLG
jgi:response regulator NasT